MRVELQLNGNAFPFPVVAVNPSLSDHLYVAYADKGETAPDKADIYLVRSTDGGATWTTRVRVNSVTNNGQWMPVIAVKPDGTQLFLAWYDRRNDPNNSLIDVYGRFATISTNGNVTLTNEFRITTTNFPPVFAGTSTNNTAEGHYDPVYPPYGVNLNWHYSEWPQPDTNMPSLYLTDDAYRGHVGEYNGIQAENGYVYLTWTDYRTKAKGTRFSRDQSDIRLVRLSWPR